MNKFSSKPVMHMRTVFAVLAALCVLTGPGALDAARAATGPSAEVASISVSPASVTPGAYPAISAVVQNKSAAAAGADGKTALDVKLVLTKPDKAVKQWSWKNSRFSADQKMQFSAPKDYDTNLAGTYKVEYFVYPAGETKQLSSRESSFTVAETVAAVKTPQSEVPVKKAEEKTAVRETPKSAPAPARQNGTAKNQAGIGLHVNVVNLSAGPAFILWPAEHFGLEFTYGMGLFTTYEVRGMYRFGPVMSMNPYLGAGYLHAEATETFKGVDFTLKESDVEVFGGVERPISKKVSVYLEAAATPLKFHSMVVVSGTSSKKESFNYSQVTANAGVIWYFF